jgi:hypothetical protein
MNEPPASGKCGSLSVNKAHWREADFVRFGEGIDQAGTIVDSRPPDNSVDVSGFYDSVIVSTDGY